MEILSDNGSQFSSCEFQDFAKEWEFSHKTSSPTTLNQMGWQKGVQTVKFMLKKAQADEKDPYLFPTDALRTPAQLCENRAFNKATNAETLHGP